MAVYLNKYNNYNLNKYNNYNLNKIKKINLLININLLNNF
jgi:hypothetical protein